MDGWIDRWMDGWMEGQTDSQQRSFLNRILDSVDSRLSLFQPVRLHMLLYLPLWNQILITIWKAK